MPKILTTKRIEGEAEKAKIYVRTHILFPSGLLGLIFMLSGTAALVYQFVGDSYGWRTFLESSGLIVAGGTLGWVQTRYHKYLLREHPGHFAGRMRTFSRTGLKRSKREASSPTLSHPGRNLVPFGYILGIVLLVGASALSSMFSQVYYVAAFLLPWAGFFWAKMFFWRGVIAPVRSGSR